MRYSLIIPVFNRPDEVAELLQSLASQTFRDFEVVVVEDGSSVPCREVVEPEEPAADFSAHYRSFQEDCALLYRHIPSLDW